MFDRIKNRKAKVDSTRVNFEVINVNEIPDGMYEKCPSCEEVMDISTLRLNKWVCLNCEYHFRMHIASRTHLIFDSFKVFNHIVKSKDPLDFPGYKEKLANLSNSTGVYDAVVIAEATIKDHEVIAIIMDPNFLMGSMGTVVGEKITRAFERALQAKKPVVMFSASGGARMQEGIMSLMQMAKTSGAVSKHSEGGNLFINILTDPTFGGVTASFAMLADIILAEPKALIGFAGPRVIEQTMRKPLPEGFQRAEFLLEKGFIDKIVDRRNLKDTLAQLLDLHEVK